VLRLVMFGRQGAGKGTQSNALSEHYGAPHISTGDILREAVASGTAFGVRAKDYMDAGQLLPDEIMLGVVADRLAEPDVREHGFLLDGYPRTVGQAEALVGLTPIDIALNLEVPEQTVLERLSSRRVCEGCGRNYSVTVRPDSDWTCDTCGGRVVQRDDDKPAAIAQRLETYRAETVPTIEWFDSKGMLVNVDGLGTPAEVTARLFRALDERLREPSG
jgi:adenylate kinase